jgi:hypothetical protein
MNDGFPRSTDSQASESARFELSHAVCRRSFVPCYAASFDYGWRGGGEIERTAWREFQWSDGNAELYAQLKDQQEVRDLSEDPARASVIRSLRELLLRVGKFQPLDGK